MTTHRSDNPFGPGDPEQGFRCLVLQYQRRITAFATRMLGGDAATAQDVAQETFLALWRQQVRDDGRYPLPDHIDRYLLRIAHNRCLDLLRVRRDTAYLDPERDATDSATGPEKMAQASSLGEAVRDAVSLLSEGQRSVFILSHYDGLRYQEIADLLDCPIGTVASRKSQAVATLRLLLKAWADHDDTDNSEKNDASQQ
ncbi:MAG: sigma-70 family RNA polymerase sigma factor [Armatimonadota bacterium]